MPGLTGIKISRIDNFELRRRGSTEETMGIPDVLLSETSILQDRLSPFLEVSRLTDKLNMTIWR